LIALQSVLDVLISLLPLHDKLNYPHPVLRAQIATVIKGQ